MAEIFPKWANQVPRQLLLGASGVALLTVLGVGYTFSPEYTDVGYKPRQPIPFSHKLHVGELAIDCRYCHSTVEISPIASLPPTETCMNCHSLVGRDSDKLAPLRESLETGEPIRWIRVHNVPDYAHFDHRPHVGTGVGCVSCHGNVAEMEETRQVEPLSMSWCLDCHRESDEYLDPPTDCNGCHH